MAGPVDYSRPERTGFLASPPRVPVSQPAAAPTVAGMVLRHLRRHSEPKLPDPDRPLVPLVLGVPRCGGVRFAHRSCPRTVSRRSPIGCPCPAGAGVRFLPALNGRVSTEVLMTKLHYRKPPWWLRHIGNWFAPRNAKLVAQLSVPGRTSGQWRTA